jgi:UDP-2-acetamido-3-amino-2,3-dideoxy-glucuronate N-acetyltransferase
MTGTLNHMPAEIYECHPTAVIDKGCSIGQGTKIWHFCHIMAGAEIGDNCNLGQNVFVAGSVKMGDGCKIQNNVSIYDGVRLEDHVFCGPSVVFTNIRTPRSHISRKDQYEETHVGRSVTLGANCTVVCGIEIGNFAFIAAGAVLTKDVMPYALMVGVPAKKIGWVGSAGLRLRNLSGESGLFVCPETGEHYRETSGRLEPEPTPLA